MPSCPPDAEETAEAYCMGRLSVEEVRAYEDHYVSCPRCVQLLQAARDYINAMKAAARDLNKRP